MYCWPALKIVATELCSLQYHSILKHLQWLVPECSRHDEHYENQLRFTWSVDSFEIVSGPWKSLQRQSLCGDLHSQQNTLQTALLMVHVQVGGLLIAAQPSSLQWLSLWTR